MIPISHRRKLRLKKAPYLVQGLGISTQYSSDDCTFQFSNCFPISQSGALQRSSMRSLGHRFQHCPGGRQVLCTRPSLGRAHAAALHGHFLEGAGVLAAPHPGCARGKRGAPSREIHRPQCGLSVWRQEGQLGVVEGALAPGVLKAHPFTHQQAFDAFTVASGDGARIPSANEAPVSLNPSSSWLVENETLHCFQVL